MKLTVFLLLVSMAGVLANKSYSQSKMLNLNMREATVKEVIKNIEEQSEFNFLYSENLIDVERKVNVTIENKKIEQALNLIFEGTDVDYSIRDRFIVLTPREAQNVFQQQIFISGTVTDQSGSPLPGVTVVVKGTTQGTITDVNGNYSLGNVSSDATLAFSFIGMKTQEIPVAGKTTIDVTMAESSIGIEEVVAIGYGTVKKSDLTGSITSISADDFELTPLKTLSSMIQGSAAGVEVVKGNAAPGGGSIIRIRGGNSMLGSNDPLYVVDGMPGGIVGNPSGIESIQILKDASATAIYGARGANGVIIITTKRGGGKPSLHAEAYYGLQKIRKKYDLLNAREYAEFANEKASNIGRAPYYPDLNDLPGSTDWQDEVFQIAPMQNYNISATGGTANNNYAIIGNYMKQDGVVKGSSYSQGNIKVNLDNTVSDRIHVSTSIAAFKNSSQQIRMGSVDGSTLYSVLTAPPLAPIFDDDGEYFLMNNIPSADPLWSNPVQRINIRDQSEVGNRIVGNTQIKIDILKGLSYSIRGGVNYYNRRTDTYTLKSPTAVNTASVSESDSYSYLLENILTFKRTFNDKHDINIIAGYNWEQNTYSGISVSAKDFLNDVVRTNNIGSAAIINTPGTSKTQSSIVSWIGRANYIFDNKYLFTVTSRVDGSTRMGANNKWGIFPSVAFGWKISEEDFMQNVSAINNLKLRASYGITGNQGIGNYKSLSTLRDLEVYMGANEDRYVVFLPSELGNPNLKWEQTAQFDIGVDLGLFGNRLDVTADYYDKQTTDLLAVVPLALSSGYSSITKNFGAMQNRGFEVGLKGRIIQSSDWMFNVDANFALNRNKVLEVAAEGGEFFAGQIGSPINAPANLIREGEPLSVLVGYTTDGLWETDQSAGSIQPTAKAGDQRYKDVNEDGTVNSDDIVILGSPYPDFIYGLNTNLAYKRLSINVLLQGAHGGSRLLVHNYVIADNFARQANQLAETKDHWSTANPDPQAKWPRLSKVAPLLSDRYIQDASYLRFKTISLAYTVPTEKMGFINNLMVYASGENLITITKYSGYDPEVESRSSSSLFKGLDDGAYPHAKTFTIGIKANF